MLSVQDYNFYAVFKKQSVYDEVTDLSYFTFTPIAYREENSIPAADRDDSYNITNGYKIDIAAGKKLFGKITLPSYYNNLPVTVLGATFGRTGTGDSANITHIFWKQTENEPCTLRATEDIGTLNTSLTMHLEYIEIPEGTRVLGVSTFQGFASLKTVNPIVPVYTQGAIIPTPVENSIILPNTLKVIDTACFINAFYNNGLISDIKVPASVVKLGGRCFTNIYTTIENFEIGSSSEGSNLHIVDVYDIVTQTGNVTVNIYTHARGSTANMTFYYKSMAQYEGFAGTGIDSYFTGILNKSYIQVN